MLRHQSGNAVAFIHKILKVQIQLQKKLHASSKRLSFPNMKYEISGFCPLFEIKCALCSDIEYILSQKMDNSKDQKSKMKGPEVSFQLSIGCSGVE